MDKSFLVIITMVMCVIFLLLLLWLFMLLPITIEAGFVDATAPEYGTKAWFNMFANQMEAVGETNWQQYLNN